MQNDRACSEAGKANAILCITVARKTFSRHRQWKRLSQPCKEKVAQAIANYICMRVGKAALKRLVWCSLKSTALCSFWNNQVDRAILYSLIEDIFRTVVQTRRRI